MDEENLETKLFPIISLEKEENREKWWKHYTGEREREYRDYTHRKEYNRNEVLHRTYMIEEYTVGNHEIEISHEKKERRIYYH